MKNLLLFLFLFPLSNQAQTIIGSWSLVCFSNLITGERDCNPDALTKPISITFKENGEISGRKLANTLSGFYTLSDNNKINIDRLVTTLVAEHGWGVNFSLLDTNTYKIVNDTLYIFYENNSKAYIFIKSESLTVFQSTISTFFSKYIAAKEILDIQPTQKQLKRRIYSGYTVDSVADNAYYLKDEAGNSLSVHFNIETLKISYVQFYERGINKISIHSYLVENLQYNFIASQHMCDFMNNKKIALEICPNRNAGDQYHISLFGM